MNSNSIAVYFKEVKNLNKRCKEVLMLVKDNPGLNSEQLINLSISKNPNHTSPRLTDLYNNGLIKVGVGTNNAGHKVNTFTVVQSNEFKPKMNSDLRIILDKLGKLSHSERMLVLDKVTELNKNG